jgi:PTH1 family peptidyl-tRNA hydrolase
MRILAGLGNPGAQYERNRHNVGFMAVDAIHRRHGFPPWNRKFQGVISTGEIAGEKVLLIKPQTYMNLSGQSVGEALRFYKLASSDLVVLYDELDLAPGKVRVKSGGGSGGHNGIKSLDAHCGKDYRRVRIGIGHPGDKALVHNYVLGDFSKSDMAWLDPLLDAIGDHAALLLKGDDSGFMNKLSVATGAAPAPAPQQAAKGVSHIRQARAKTPTVAAPKEGPMADLLRRILGGRSGEDKG